MSLSPQAKHDLHWWSHHLTFASHFIHTPAVSLTLFSDASLEGWCGTDGTTHVGGRWTAEESPVHINVLELHAAKLTLLALVPGVSDSHIRLMLVNTTIAAYIEKMGGLHSPACNAITLSIWGWAKERNNWLSTAFIPRIENTVADFHSQNFRDNTEWMFNPAVFQQLTKVYFVPEVDLFASRLNCQIHPFVSWKPNRGHGQLMLFPFLGLI